MLRAQLKARLARGVARARDRRRGRERRAGAGAASTSIEPDVAFLDIRMPVQVRPRRRARARRTLPRRVRHRLRRIRGRGVRRRRRRLRAEAGDAPSAIAKVVARRQGAARARRRSISPRCSRGSRERDARAAPLKWIRASLGATMQLIAVDDVVYFQAEDKYTKVVTDGRRGADQEADQGALRRARPRGVLADPSRHDRQPARDRARRARLARPAGDHAQARAREAHRVADVRAPLQGDVACRAAVERLRCAQRMGIAPRSRAPHAGRRRRRPQGAVRARAARLAHRAVPSDV